MSTTRRGIPLRRKTGRLEDWKTGLEPAKKKLGLKDEVINKYVADVFLDAGKLLWPPTT